MENNPLLNQFLILSGADVVHYGNDFRYSAIHHSESPGTGAVARKTLWEESKGRCWRAGKAGAAVVQTGRHGTADRDILTGSIDG